MHPAVRYLIDGAAGAALAFSLLLVFVVDRVFFAKTPPGPATNTLEVRFITSDSDKPVKKVLKLGVTPTGRLMFNILNPQKPDLWDDMGKLLTKMGGDYAKFDILKPKDFIQDPKILDGYDVLFLTCADSTGAGEEGIAKVLRDYVEKGGTLYASDWRYEVVGGEKGAFPEIGDKDLFGYGARQSLEADIVDPGLAEALGTPNAPKKKLHLTFDLQNWKTAAFGPRATTMIKATYKKEPKKNQVGDIFAEAPLLVKFKVGKGMVIFTSFHNEKQNNEDEEKLLKHLIYSLVTAGEDAKTQEELQKLGFEPQRTNLLSTARGNPSVTKEYKNKQKSTLRFTLSIPTTQKAKLSFNIKSPDDKEYTKETESTLSLEVPEAMDGIWRYTVTALEGTSENATFSVTVAEKK